MGVTNDYEDMSQNSWSDFEVESLLRGRTPRDPELAELTPWIAAVRTGLDVAPTDSQVAALTPALASAAREAAAHGAARHARTRRVTVAGIAAVALGFGVAGAAAADSAAPGSPLYVVDRALEAVGINDGGTDERLDEATTLLDQGDTAGAIDLVAQAAGDEGDNDAKESLLAVAEQLRQNGSENSADVHAAVADMLTWKATTDATGKAFGQGVAALAKEIGHGHGKPGVTTPSASPSPEPSLGPDDMLGNGAPDHTGKPDNPGKSEGAGKPDHTGKPDNPGKSTGKPDNAGKPDHTGKPDNAGKPDNPGKSAGKPGNTGKP